MASVDLDNGGTSRAYLVNRSQSQTSSGAGTASTTGPWPSRTLLDEDGPVSGARRAAALAASTDEILIGKEKAALIASVSALIAGFTVVALVELDVPEGVNDQLTVVYSLLSTILIVIHLFATLVAVSVLPALELMLHLMGGEEQEARNVREQYRLYRYYVELAWTCSVGIGFLLFLAELIVVVWVKLSHISIVATITTTVLLGIVIVIFTYYAITLRNREGAFLMALVNHRRKRLDAYDQAALNIPRAVS